MTLCLVALDPNLWHHDLDTHFTQHVHFLVDFTFYIMGVVSMTEYTWSSTWLGTGSAGWLAGLGICKPGAQQQ